MFWSSALAATVAAHHQVAHDQEPQSPLMYTACETKQEVKINRRQEDTRSSQFSLAKNRIIFMGTGSSTGCPMPRCAMVLGGSSDVSELSHYQTLLRDRCKVSLEAIQGGDPRNNRNYRNNPSLVISHQVPVMTEGIATGTTTKNIIIDVGKTFRETSLRWFPIRNIQSLDAVVLTHEHADASFGLDDLRGYQKYELASLESDKLKHKRSVQIPMPVFLSQHCLEDLAGRFTWLFPNHQQPMKQRPKDSDKPVVERHVASLDVQVFEPFVPFHAAGLCIVPLPVMHGEDLVSFGFAFTVGQTNIVYLSDLSRMLPETLEYIHTKLPPTDILVVDALHPEKTNPAHFNMKEAVELARQINPRSQTLLVGMSCDSFLLHDEMNQALAAKYGNVQLAHDGLEIEC